MNQQARWGMGCAASMAALLLTGCAAVVDGVSQPVSVKVRSNDGQEIAGANCRLDNAKGTWYATTPGSVVVHRAMGDLRVSCTKPGTTIANISANASADGWIFGNLLIGGIIGLAVDLGTGSGFRYPDNITIAGRVDTAALAFDSARNAAVLPAVRRGVTGRVPTLVAAHADPGDMCQASGGTPAVEVIESSRHGSVEVRAGQFAGPDAQAARACSGGTIYGTQIYYQANADFHGSDRVRYIVATATGRFEREVDIDVD